MATLQELIDAAELIRDETAQSANTANRVGTLFIDILEAAAITVTGIQGEQGIQGAKIVSAAFVGNDLVFTLDDASTVTIINAKITLVGATGATGATGDAPDHEWASTTLRFKLPNGTWGTAVDLKGATGAKGDDGDSIVGPPGEAGGIGPSGKEVELRVSGGYIQWRLVDGIWANLIEIASISGKEVELRVDNNNLQWKYTVDVNWITLISLWELLGITRRVIVVEDNYSILPQDKSVLAGNTTKNIELSLPQISTVGLQEITVRMNKGGDFAVTVLISGTDTINFDSVSMTGVTTTTLGSWITFTSDEDSGSWYVTAGGENWALAI